MGQVFSKITQERVWWQLKPLASNNHRQSNKITLTQKIVDSHQATIERLQSLCQTVMVTGQRRFAWRVSTSADLATDAKLGSGGRQRRWKFIPQSSQNDDDANQ